MADVTIEDAAKEEWDLVALPGGMPGKNYIQYRVAKTGITQEMLFQLTQQREISLLLTCWYLSCSFVRYALLLFLKNVPKKISLSGATNLKESQALTQILEKQKAAKKLYGAVCASPAVVLASQGLLDETSPATCYPAPSFREQLKIVSNDSVVIADNVVTSQGPGTSLGFALALGEQLYGKEKRDEIAKQMLVAWIYLALY